MIDLLAGLSPQLVLVGTALLILLSHVLGRDVHATSYGMTGLAGAGILALYLPSSGTVHLLRLDGFAHGATALLALAGLLVLGLSRGYLKRRELRSVEWTFLVLMAVVGLSLMYSSYHLFVLFLGLELSSLSLYVLCGYRRTDTRSLEASLKYFILGSVGSAVLLLGIALLFVSQRTVVVTEFLTAGGLSGLTVGLIVLMTGLLFKLSIVPLHVWVPDVYEGAPTPVTAFMSVAVKVSVLAVLVRLLHDAGVPGRVDWGQVLWWLAALTMVAGNLLALVQESVKRMLAYSSIAHAGYLAVGLAALSPSGYSAVAFYAAVYVLMTVPAFGVVMLVAGSRGEDYSYESLQGLGGTHPVLAVGLAVCMISLSGLPPTAGFMGKLLLFRAAVEAGMADLAVLGVLASVVSVAYYFRVLVHAFMRGPEGDRTAPAFQVGLLAAASTLLPAFLLIVLGVLPSGLYTVSQSLLAALA